MELSLYQIDAFSSRVFKGNPAAVCPLDEWLPDETMQSIALENNLSETAFFIPENGGFHIRWFTPASEVDLCGHATLGSAFVLFNILDYQEEAIQFNSKSGMLVVTQQDDWLTLDFPIQPPVPCETPEELVLAFSKAPVECLVSEDLMAVFKYETDVELAEPNMEQLKKLDARGVIITAESAHYDFVARFFAPKYGVPEDPVTGSAFTQLAPYWAFRLGDKKFKAKQVSSRGGEVLCEIVGDRVLISGKATKYMEGTITI
jgi:PhzF family phenazine biosynthesis protein